MTPRRAEPPLAFADGVGRVVRPAGFDGAETGRFCTGVHRYPEDEGLPACPGRCSANSMIQAPWREIPDLGMAVAAGSPRRL